MPLPAYEVGPQYPDELRAAGVTGEAMVLFTVKADGTVADPKVIESNDRVFGRAAVDALLQWRFRPALVGGHPVDCRVMQSLEFTLAGKNG
jgi:protein TonB